ncbi:MAG TPA: 3-hydroxybutyryl-CoA dehydrogenase [Candidatus Xenobia bacterium]|jgi:3-hydroxybutyryl-CoA dehydrogenase
MTTAVQDKPALNIKKIAVVGAGAMGAGIAQVASAAGVSVIMRDMGDEQLQRARKTVDQSLSRVVKKGTISEADKEKILSNIKTTTELKDLADADLLIEAVFEDMAVKKELFAQLQSIVKPSCIFASNTSSLSVTEMAVVSRRPERFVGLHFFNPVPVMKLVEVVRTPFTQDDVFQTAWNVALHMGKAPIACKDTPGFIFNRLIIPYLNEALWAISEGIGSVDDIDRAMKLGGNMPIGPLALLDLVGIDVQLHACESLLQEFGDPKFRPCPLNRRMVRAGLLGKKTGQGFYDYSQDPPKPMPLHAILG